MCLVLLLGSAKALPCLPGRAVCRSWPDTGRPTHDGEDIVTYEPIISQEVYEYFITTDGRS
jgi:hypothetical protein